MATEWKKMSSGGGANKIITTKTSAFLPPVVSWSFKLTERPFI